MSNKVIIIDVEALCWPYKTEEKSQIIEIGACLLDVKSLVISNKKSIYIKPVYGKVHKFCSKLTGITQEFLDKNGISYESAIAQLKSEYKTTHRAWASWGDYDRTMFEKHSNILEYPLAHTKYPFTKRHTNVKSLYEVMCGEDKGLSLSAAVTLIGKEFYGKAHCGADDAYNVATVYAYIMERYRDGVIHWFQRNSEGTDWSI